MLHNKVIESKCESTEKTLLNCYFDGMLLNENIVITCHRCLPLIVVCR